MAVRSSVTIEASWLLRPVLHLARIQGHPQRLLNQRLGASSVEAVLGGTRLRVPRTVAFELLEDLARETGVPDLGLQAIGRRPLETLLDYLFVTSRTMGEALTALTATNRLNNDSPFELEEQEERVILRQHLGTDRARQFGEGAGSTLVHIMRASVAPSWVPLEIRFPHQRPTRTTTLEEHFRCPIRFGAPSFELHLAREDCALPFSRSDPGLHALLRQIAAEQLALLPQSTDSTGSAIRAFLREMLARRRTVSVEVVADQLRMSVRTLQRRLRDEGTDYLTLLDDVRRELATKLLSEGTRQLEDVASLIGFGNASSLNRAVRRWTGDTPRRFRRN